MFRGFIFIVLFTFGQNSYAENKPIIHHVTGGIAHTFEDFKTVGAYMGWVSTVISPEDFKATQKLVTKYNINPDMAWPKLKVKGNVITVGKDTLAFYDGYVLINKKKFILKEGTFHESLAAICKKTKCSNAKKYSGLNSLVIDEAHAIFGLGRFFSGFLFGVAATIFVPKIWRWWKKRRNRRRTTSYQSPEAYEYGGVVHRDMVERREAGQRYMCTANGDVVFQDRDGTVKSIDPSLLAKDGTCEQKIALMNRVIDRNIENGVTTDEAVTAIPSKKPLRGTSSTKD